MAIRDNQDLINYLQGIKVINIAKINSLQQKIKDMEIQIAENKESIDILEQDNYDIDAIIKLISPN